MQRVQSKSLYENFKFHQARLRKKIYNENEMNLWYGVKNEAVKNICTFGFTNNYCSGVNGFKLVSISKLYCFSYLYIFLEKVTNTATVSTFLLILHTLTISLMCPLRPALEKCFERVSWSEEILWAMKN